MWCCFFFFFLPLLNCALQHVFSTATRNHRMGGLGCNRLVFTVPGVPRLSRAKAVWNQRPGSPSETGPAQQQHQEMPVLLHNPLGCVIWARARWGDWPKPEEDLSPGQLFPAPNALAIAPRPFWKRLFSSSHEEVGRARLHKNSTFLMIFLLLFRLKSTRREKLFQAVWRAHNAWPPFHEVRLEEVTANPTVAMADEIQPASGVSPGASMRSQQCAQSPAWCLHVWLAIHTHIHGCRQTTSWSKRTWTQALAQMVWAGRALPCCVFG